MAAVGARENEGNRSVALFMVEEQQRPPASLQQLLPCENEILATQPVALTLLSVEERLLLIDASTPLQGLSRLQKLVLAVSMQVWIFPAGTEISRCEEDASGIFLLIQGKARSYPGAPALYSKLPNASFDLELMQYFGALPDTCLNMSSTYVFTVKAISPVICAVWTAKEFRLQMTGDMTQMIVSQSAAVECLRRTARENPEYTKLGSYVQRQITAGIKSYPDRPRRTETFDWNADDGDEDHSKTDVLVAELVRKKIGPVEKAFSEYLKASGQAKLVQLINQIDITGNGKVEYSEFRTWVHNHHPSICSETLKDHAIALAFKRTLDDSRAKKSYIGPGDIKNLLATTLVFSKALLVFDVNDGSRDHSISLADFKRSLVHMDIHLPDIVANQEFAAIDVDRSGSISFSEYTDYILKHKQATMKGKEFKASSHTSAHTDGSDAAQEHDWDSDDSVCLMEDVEPGRARGMVLMKSVRVKPKLTRMGEDVLLTSKDSAIMKSKRWAKEREGQLQRDQSDVPVRFKEIKNVGFTQHSCNGMSIDWKNPLNRMHQPKLNKISASHSLASGQGNNVAQFVEDNLPQPESGAICRLPILKHMFETLQH